MKNPEEMNTGSRLAVQAVAFLLLAVVVMALVTTVSATRREHMKKTSTKVVSAPVQPVAGPVEVKFSPKGEIEK